MNHLIVEKIIIIILLILWGFDTFRTRKRKRYDPAIEAADASERYQWRYLRWGFRIIQVVAGVYIVVQLIQGFTEIEGRRQGGGTDTSG
ncbi:hypothetical protein LNO89_01400 [Klebsiella pneumoniae subsp. pneumoniae]|nr:hypothetical protein [Klebsiella pneumoniae subsp. pneumoniae]